MITLSSNINRVHYFGDKIIVNTETDMIKLNKEMSDLMKIVIQHGPCTIENISKLYAKKHMSIYEFNDGKQLIELIEQFIERTAIGKQLFSRDISQNKELIISGVEGKYFPTTLSFELTNKCNLCCSHCYKSASQNKNTYIDFNLIKSLCDFIIPANVNFSITGGECTLHPQFQSIIAYLHSRGKVDMVTNGILLSKIDKSVLKMFSVICISLYGTTNEEYYNNTGIKNGIESIKATTRVLSENNCMFNMSIVLDKNKIKNLERYVEFAYQCGANNIQMGVPAKSGKLTTITPHNNVWDLNDNDLKYAYRLQRELEKKYSGKIRIVTWDRDVYEKKYRYGDPYNISNFYAPHCMKCGAGVWHWIISENFKFRPCALLPESFSQATFTYDTFKSFVNGDVHLNWEKIMLDFEKLCKKEGRSAEDYCSNFTNFLHENI